MDSTNTTMQFGDDVEKADGKAKISNRKLSVSENKTETKTTKMKRLKFKNTFNGVGNALQLIPETYKVDGKTFQMTDGNENYEIRWEGTLTEGKAVILKASDKNMINEDMAHMKHLMGYNSLNTLGTLKGKERLSENDSFGDMMRKTKALLLNEADKGEKVITEEGSGVGGTNVAGMGFVSDVSEDVVEETENIEGQNPPVVKEDDNIEGQKAPIVKDDNVPHAGAEGDMVMNEDDDEDEDDEKDRFDEVFSGLEEEVAEE